MSKDLVVGACGFLGRHLIPSLLADGNEVVAQDILPPDTARKLLPSSVKYVWKSMVDMNQTDLDGVDNVALLAAVTDVPFAINSPQWTFYQNTAGPIATLEVARRMKTSPKILIMSSESAYGRVPLDHLPIREEEALRPANIYGASKAAADMIARLYNEAFGVPAVVFRSTSMFGEMSRSAQVIPIFINQALDNRDITIEGDGSQTRDFNYVGNMVGAIQKLFNTPELRSGIFNIGSGADISLKELAEMIIKLSGSSSIITYKDWRPGEKGIKLMVSLDNSHNILGYHPVYTFEQGMERTINWFRDQRK
jgi:UDP-glucose 4-epimerase